MCYISALTRAIVLSKNVHLGFKAIAIDTNNISYTVRYGLRGKARFVMNLPCMWIFIIWAEAS